MVKAKVAQLLINFLLFLISNKQEYIIIYGYSQTDLLLDSWPT